eukprot:gnl/TRDRNA2_/TRDRNA2_147181_c0_seq1.p1 gnl/TRDRNA2_/TRDRNA2_147181_c0~~gnl/TRDRNA2_/TRDRNA2_147181_c0_seq1.p1  ORF type:complete len:218 (+),score=47.40 gnl/TRDRNA2_/TRDRNA2_147181_c0_seq1:123-776(+)
MDDGSKKSFKSENLVAVGAGARSTQDAVPEKDSTSALRKGCRVRLTGLKANPALNGQEGVLFDYVEAEGRWQVRMTDGAAKTIKPCNLICVADPDEGSAGCSTSTSRPLSAGMAATISGLKTLPELNGAACTLVALDQADGRWRVRLADGAEKKVWTTNLTATGSKLPGKSSRVPASEAKPPVFTFVPNVVSFESDDDGDEDWRYGPLGKAGLKAQG